MSWTTPLGSLNVSSVFVVGAFSLFFVSIDVISDCGLFPVELDSVGVSSMLGDVFVLSVEQFATLSRFSNVGDC